MLQLQHISKAFGKHLVLADVSFSVPQGSITGIVGKNGSGKSTFFAILARRLSPTSGKALLDDTDILRVPLGRIARVGVALLTQHTELIGHANAIENVLLGTYQHRQYDVCARWRRGYRDTRAKAQELLNRLRVREQTPARELTHYEARLVELARAVMMSPRLLLLDEPTAGFSQSERSTFLAVLRSIDLGNMSALLIEHDRSFAEEACDDLFLMENGVAHIQQPASRMSVAHV